MGRRRDLHCHSTGLDVVFQWCLICFLAGSLVGQWPRLLTRLWWNRP
jgi:hypothetical protein